MNRIKNWTLMTLTLSLLWSCNPDCDSIVNLQSISQAACEGDQIVLTANPLSSLDGRRVYFDDVQADAVYERNTGLVVTVPAGKGLDGQTKIRVEDPDCVDFAEINFNVVDEAYFVNNPDYVFPLVPEIIIPNLPQDFPPSIENAWLHPENIDYCIWFTLLSDNSGNCLRIIDPENSFEQSTCFKDNPNYGDLLYQNNPMSGYIDAEDNVFVTIHRAGGEEHFQGKMVNLEDVPAKYHEWSFPNPLPADCNPGLPAGSTGPIPERNHMMVLRSLYSGKQMLIYQQAIDLVDPTCL